MRSKLLRWRPEPKGNAVLVASALAGLSLLWAASATAGTLTVQYQITGGTYEGAPLPNPGGTYTVRLTATGPGTVVSGPATLLTLNPSSGLLPTLLLGEAGSAGPIGHPTFTHLGSVSRSATQVSGTTTATPCHGFVQFSGSVRYPQHSASWSGIVGAGSPGKLSVAASTLRVWNYCDLLYSSTIQRSGTYIGTEINSSYVPEPSTLPLVVGGLVLAAGVAGRRRTRRS